MKPSHPLTIAGRCPRSCARARIAGDRAFTLIEMLVVIAMLALLAAIVFPRLTGNTARRAAFTAEQTADLLTLFAHRANLGEDGIALHYDPEAKVISIIEQKGDPMNPNDPARWDFDVYGSRVRLPQDMAVTNVRRDGRLFSIENEWFLPVIPGEGRPNIELDLQSDAGNTYTVYLASFEINAKIIKGDDDTNLHRLPIDLDAEGRTRERW